MNRSASSLLLVIGFLLWAALPAGADDETTLAAFASQQITGPDGVCKLVTNTTGNPLAVSTYNTAEWQSFYNSPGSATVATCQCAAGTASWAAIARPPSAG